MKRLIVGVSGASAMPLTACLLQNLHYLSDVEVHLIISPGAERVLRHECNREADSFRAYAHTVYDAADMAAGPSSGSWHHDGMIVCPCSMSSLASIASGAGINLLHRAADVTLKEGRKLIIVPRETPLNIIHIENMRRLAMAGAVIMPFMPAFYFLPQNIEDMLAHFCGRILDQMSLENGLVKRWHNNL